jgi:hypothetical protein
MRQNLLQDCARQLKEKATRGHGNHLLLLSHLIEIIVIAFLQGEAKWGGVLNFGYGPRSR